ncbi:MAG: amidase family protein [Propionibacteriales bacterium]|nr:amidase family protein [Propionibacteriales bacterium]
MDVDDLVGRGPATLVPLLRDRTVSARELTIATLDAIEREDARVNAVVELLADEAFDASTEADARIARGETGPLLGVPVAIKNDVDLAGRVTGLGSRAVTRVARQDGPLVEVLLAAGAVPVATTTLPELAIYGFTESAARGVTRNPHDLDRTPGGSSGGSAALVAAGAVGVATASDGAGSIRIPAASCGLVGFKTTHGFVPGSGGWHGLSTQGCVTPTVRDTAVYLDAVGRGAPGALAHAADTPPRVLRIGVTTSAAAAGRPEALHRDVRSAVDHVAGLLDGLGHEVAAVKVPYGLDAKALTVRYLAGIAGSASHVDDPSQLEPRTRQVVRLGRPFGPSAVAWAQRAGLRFGSTVLDRLGVDVLLSPVMSGPALPVGHFAGKGGLRTVLGMNAFYPYTAQWNHAGLPAVSLPVGRSRKRGLPLAVQLVARREQDPLLMSVASQVEAALRDSA